MSKLHRQGDLGEAAFQHRALELGLRLSRPVSICEPYDFIVDSGRNRWRVQIKSSRAITRWKMYNVWCSRNTNPGLRSR